MSRVNSYLFEFRFLVLVGRHCRSASNIVPLVDTDWLWH